jgi:hypothetical protein
MVSVLNVLVQQQLGYNSTFSGTKGVVVNKFDCICICYIYVYGYFSAIYHILYTLGGNFNSLHRLSLHIYM